MNIDKESNDFSQEDKMRVSWKVFYPLFLFLKYLLCVNFIHIFGVRWRK